MNAYRKGVRLALTISPRANKAIDELLATGLYGRSRAEVAQRFVYQGLREQPMEWTDLGGPAVSEPHYRQSASVRRSGASPSAAKRSAGRLRGSSR